MIYYSISTPWQFRYFFCHIRLEIIHVMQVIVLIYIQVGFHICILYFSNAWYKIIEYENTAHVQVSTTPYLHGLFLIGFIQEILSLQSFL